MTMQTYNWSDVGAATRATLMQRPAVADDASIRAAAAAIIETCHARLAGRGANVAPVTQATPSHSDSNETEDESSCSAS